MNMAKKKATKKVVKKGRPPTYTKKQKETMLRLAPLGFTNEEIVNIIGCAKSTFYKWLEEDKDLSDSLKSAKELADGEVIQSLFNQALGRCKTTEVISGIDPNTGNIIETTKVKEIPPSASATIFFLKNRQPDKWRDKREIEHSGESTIKIDSDDAAL